MKHMGIYKREIIPKGMKIEATVECRLCQGLGESADKNGDHQEECPQCQGEGGEPITLILTEDVDYLGKLVA